LIRLPSIRPLQGQPAALEFEAAAAELVLLPRSKLLPLGQPEQALADAAGMLGRQVGTSAHAYCFVSDNMQACRLDGPGSVAHDFLTNCVALGISGSTHWRTTARLATCRQEVPVLLTALLTLRRVAIHHPQLLDDSLEDVSQVLLECMHGGSPPVCQAAVMALLDLMISFGSGMLKHLEHDGGLPQYSCLLALLLAASRGRTPAIRAWANEALRWASLGVFRCWFPARVLFAEQQHGVPTGARLTAACWGTSWLGTGTCTAHCLTIISQCPCCSAVDRFMAERLQQSRVIRALERYLEYPVPAVRTKAAEWLMVRRQARWLGCSRLNMLLGAWREAQ